VIWGGLHGLFLVFSAATQSSRLAGTRAVGLTRFPNIHAGVQVLSTFFLVCIGWIFFRAHSLTDALTMCSRLAADSLWLLDPARLYGALVNVGLGPAIIGIVGMLLVEAIHVLQRQKAIQPLLKAQPWWLRWGAYYAGAAGLFLLFAEDGDQFIYFQF
jgi:D-alanyl-lipoteichoic acid acyltransferase DltB (MBOAT superfamily)